MAKFRTTTIAVETEETVVLRIWRPLRAGCPACGAEMARPEAAAVATGLRPREIYRRVEAGTVHFLESEDGALAVCLDSLRDTYEDRR
jgi:hypothetical protein